jgi:DNA-binding Lrp family transcriptional regulator
MEGLKERSPEKAKELENLRDKDPEKFNAELRRHAREEFGKVVKERIEKLRQQRQAEFLEWLAKNVSDEAEELAKLKERSPNLYGEKYELVWKKYGRTFEESRRSPELAQVLIEDIRLQKRRDQLLGKINTTTSQREKKKLTAELEEVVGHRYDLIVRRKQIAYEWLLKRLEELQNRINESSADIRKAQDTKVKAENIKKRTQELLEEKKGFNWN